MANETKKSLVEEALLQMKNLEEAVTENAKGILASTMKEEISELVKESLSEEEEIEMVDMEESSKMEEGSEMAEQEMELDMEDGEEEMDIDMDMESDEDSEMEDEGEEMDMEDVEDMLMMDLPGDELEVDDEEEVLLPLDLTGASDEEILKVFKAMGEEDGIIISQDGDDVVLKDEEADVEYKIQMESEEKEEEMAEEVSEEDMDEVVYEIEVSEEDDMDEEYKEEEMAEGKYGMNKGDEYHRKDVGGHEVEDGKYGAFESEMKEMSDNEADIKNDEYHIEDLEDDIKDREEKSEGEAVEGMVRSHAAGQEASSDKSKGLPKPHSVPNKARLGEGTEKELQQLREKNEEYRKALNIFKEKLNEVAVFNSNLAYATRLFTENTTTKQEKINILRRFDSVETLKESKGLYKTLKEEFESKEANTISESMTEKVSKTPVKGSSANLIESKTYENPQFMRMKDLMSKIIK
ncbi:hypothetical protein N9H63_01440 [bacterium]|nr:hypothetical protein [bacterium]